MRSPVMATSRIPSTFRDGSITRPPLMTRSYFTAVAPNRFGRFAHAAAPKAAAPDTNWRRFMGGKLSFQAEGCPKQSAGMETSPPAGPFNSVFKEGSGLGVHFR